MVKWINVIKDAAEKSIPKNKINYYVHPKGTDILKILESLYKQLKNTIIWNRVQFIMLRNIQEQLKLEIMQIYKEK